MAKFTGEAFVVHALFYNEDGTKRDELEIFKVKEGENPNDVRDRANRMGGALRKRGAAHAFVYHGFLMRWDGEKLVDR